MLKHPVVGTSIITQHHNDKIAISVKRALEGNWIWELQPLRELG